MPQERDAEGRFTFKDRDRREVRTIRLTDTTWAALGAAADYLKMTRADLLEQVVKEGRLSLTAGLEPAPLSLTHEELVALAEQVLGELKLGKQAPGFKAAQKALKRLLELASTR